MPQDDTSNGEPQLKSAVTIWNDSGGVGKTTLTINTAESLSRMGEKVLVIDLDPQYGGLTDHAGFEGALTHEKFNIVDVVLMQNRSLNEIVIPADDDRNDLSWDLIPAHQDLEKFGRKLDNNLPPNENGLVKLRKNILEAGLHMNYDYILIDCRASRGELVANAIAATLNVMIPTECSRKGSRSVDGLVNYVENKQREIRRADTVPDNAKTNVVSIVPNNAAKTGSLTNNEKAAVKHLLSEYPTRMMNFYIPSRAALAEAWMGQRPLIKYIENNDERDFRDNEKSLPVMFDLLAEVIRVGDANAVDDSHVKNIPDDLYPQPVTSDSEGADNTALMGGAQ